MQFYTKTLSMEKMFPLMGMFDDIAVSVKGPLTCGWEITYPVAYTKTEKEYDEMTDILASAMRVLPAWSVVHRQDVYYREEYDVEDGKDTSFLGRSFNAHHRGRKHLVHRSYIFVTRCPKGYVMKEGRNSGFFGVNGLGDVPTERELSVFKTQCNEFMVVMESCSNIKLRVLRERDWLGEGPEPGFLQRYFMLGSREPIMSDIQMNHESVSVYDKEAFMIILADSDHLPGEVSNISRVEKLSGVSNDVYLSTGAKVGINLDCEHVVNEIFIIPDQAELVKELDTTRKEMVSGISSTDNRLNSEEMQVFLDDAYSQGLICLETHVNVVAWDTRENMTDLYGKMSSAIKSMGCKAVFNKHSMPVSWYACCPGCAFEIGTENLMKMELKSALCLLPCETFDTDLEGGTLRLCDRIRNIPLTLDTQLVAAKRGWIGNYNVFVLGSSGSGKSFFTNTYIRNLYDAGEYVFDIDVGGSYWGLAHIINEESGGKDGQYFEFSLEHPLTFGPFHNIKRWFNEKGDIIKDDPDINVFVLFLQTVFRPVSGWTATSTAILHDFVNKFIENRRNVAEAPIFEDFYMYMEKDVAPKVKHPLLTEEDCRKRRIIELTDERKADAKKKKKTFSLTTELKNELEVEADRWLQDNKKGVEAMILEDAVKNGYVIGTTPVTVANFDMDAFMPAMAEYRLDGVYGFLLNDRHPKDLANSRFVVIDLEALQDKKKTAFYSACVLFITHEFENRMRFDRGIFKNFIIDEAWSAIANETLGPYLQELWKTARKNNCSAMCITQQISDIMASSYIRDTIQQNSDVKILLDQKSNMNNFDTMTALLNLSPQDKNIVLSMNNANNPAYLYKEVFISLGNQRSAVYAVEVSEEELVAYESNHEKKKPYVDLCRQMGSYIKAAKAIADNIRRQNQQ